MTSGSFEHSGKFHSKSLAPLDGGRGFARGGGYAPWFYSMHLAVDFNDGGKQIREFRDVNGKERSRFRGADQYFKPGLTYPFRSTLGFHVRILPSDCVFTIQGPSIVAGECDHWLLLAYLNSTLAKLFLECQGSAGAWQVGYVQAIPYIEPRDADARTRIRELASEIVDVLREEESYNETSPYFLAPFVKSCPDLDTLVAIQNARRAQGQSVIAGNENSIDEEYARSVGMGRAEILALYRLVRGLDGESRSAMASQETKDAGAFRLVSYLLGCAFGRWTPGAQRSAGNASRGVDPFAPLPNPPPAAARNADSASHVRILVDDDGSDHDIVQAIMAGIVSVFDDKFGVLLGQIEDALKTVDIRHWLRTDFFGAHVRHYSESHRKAPVYWQLASSSAQYSIWMCFPHSDADCLYAILNDHVDPKIAHESRVLEELSRHGADGSNRSQRRDLAAQELLLGELRYLREEVARVAPLWNPDINDGVIINFAPLWRLADHNRSWQNECKATWEKLCQGAYDWAHLALRLWPERVVPKCARDRSLAIAHNLEDAFWHEDSDGKWVPRKLSQDEIDALIQERTSVAVKDALKGLLEAPAPSTGRASRTKAPRAKGTRKRAASARPKAATNDASSPGRSLAAADVELLSKVREAIDFNGDGASKADVIDATGISASEWNKAIKALLADGSVTQTGERRGARYHLAGGEA